MYHTIYQKNAQRNKGSGDFWKILIVATVILVVAVPLLTNGNYVAIGPSPILIFIIWRSTRNKVESHNFYVSENHKGDFEFGYKDGKNRHYGPFPLDEYTYWFYENPSKGKPWNYELYIQINSKLTTIYLKEKIVAQLPPPEWTNSTQQIQDSEIVFYLPELINLAGMIDRGAERSAKETTPVTNQENN
jgi:hypothetical protein